MPVAMVTGASRGIGKAVCVHLARAGYDIAVTARTVEEGEQREHSSTVRKSDTTPLPGSLAATSALIQAEGARVLAVPADLTDRPSVIAAAERVLAEWGSVDVLVNNGRYIGPGHMDWFVDTPLELLDKHLEANVMAPLALIKVVLPTMLANGSGVIVNVTSGAGWHDPPATAGNGGWGIGYAMSKAALHRVAGILALELAETPVRIYNVHPDLVVTERILQDMGAFAIDPSNGAPPDVMGVVLRWLLENPEAAEAAVQDVDGRNIESQDLCRRLGLLPEWRT